MISISTAVPAMKVQRRCVAPVPSIAPAAQAGALSKGDRGWGQGGGGRGPQGRTRRHDLVDCLPHAPRIQAARARPLPILIRGGAG